VCVVIYIDEFWVLKVWKKKKNEIMGPKAMVTTGSIFQILAKPHKQKN